MLRSTVVHPQTRGAWDAFQQAVALHRQGRIHEAEPLYRIVLETDERHFDSLFCLGQIKLQQKMFDAAADLFRRATKIERRSADAHHFLGIALTGLGRPTEAVRRYEKALSIRPHFAEAHNNLGYTLQMLGRMEDAIAHYKKALAHTPTYSEARNNLGNALQMQGRSKEAIAQFEHSIAADPDDTVAYTSLGNVLGTLGRHEEAIVQYEKALAINAGIPETHNSLAGALGVLGRYDEARIHCEAALAIRPDLVDARINLCNVLFALGRHEEALTQYGKALAERPHDAVVLIKQGNTFGALERFDEASASFEKALAIAPDNELAVSGLARSANSSCDWARTTKVGKMVVALTAAGKSPVQPFTFLTYCSDPALQLACAKTYVRKEIPVLPERLWDGKIWQNKRIRIAYVAVGFHDHPTAYSTVELFERHDRSRFELFGVSLGPDDRSDIRSRIKQSFDQFHDVRTQSSRDIARLLNDMQIDIVVDRSGYTLDARAELLAYRPAPIQVNYIGFPGTLGADFYDYVIADRVVLPFDQQAFYSERIVHLPESYLVNSKRAIAAQIPTRKQAGLPEQGFVFCSFNNNYKITPSVYDVWMRLLGAVEGSVLWLYQSNRCAEANLRKEATTRGINPERLVFARRVKLDEHLARHSLADLFLDTLPVNAHTTANDALWAGLPLVTCLGESFAGRVAASVLQSAGLGELVTNTLEDYEALALRLAKSPLLLSAMRKKLKRNQHSHPLFDSDRYRRQIEAAYIKMWEIWQRGEPTHSFALAGGQT
jgi:protein O-GlcNAc transferase